MSGELTGRVHSLESFGLVDGPGVRFVVFLKGCRMRCQYCHNPDTWTGEGEAWTAPELYRHLRRYRSYWKQNGGITVSGGEPLLQMDFVTELFTLAKQENVHTALDTAGEPFSESPDWLRRFERLTAVTDLFLLDLKAMDDGLHRMVTGVGNANILTMARYLSAHGKKLWIRHVLVPGLTDGEEDLLRMREFIDSLQTVERVEILPYHTLGTVKWQELNLPYPLKGFPVPTEEEIARAERLCGIVKAGE